VVGERADQVLRGDDALELRVDVGRRLLVVAEVGEEDRALADERETVAAGETGEVAQVGGRLDEQRVEALTLEPLAYAGDALAQPSSSLLRRTSASR